MEFSRSNDGGSARGAGPNRCVWMTAGVLSYQLCERDMDCDQCPLDAALRRHFARPAVESESNPGSGCGAQVRDADAIPARATTDRRLPADRRYGRCHSWFRLRSSGTRAAGGGRIGRVGLEPGFAPLLLAPREAVLPRPGERVRAGGPLCWFVTEGGTFPVPSPCAGSVVRGNPRLVAEPSLPARDPLDSGWLVELECTADEYRAATWLEGPEAQLLWGRDRARFERELAAALRSPAGDVGPTLADGGRPLAHLSDMLGAARWFGLVRDAFLRG